jgi:hypothetical protein
MKNSVTDFIANSMDAALKSEEYKSMFRTSYNKYASADEVEEKVEVDTDDAKDKCKECHKAPCKCDMAKADDVEVDSADSDDVKPYDFESADDSLGVAAAYEIALDSLVTASSALDALGLEKSAEYSLRLASIVSEAKKKEVDKEKLKADKEKEKARKEKDLQMAKDKKAKEKAKAEAEKEKLKKQKDLAMAKDKAAKEKEKERLAKEKEAKLKADKEKSKK